jgi:branched-chain amino acid transport system substrate-binding protein
VSKLARILFRGLIITAIGACLTLNCGPGSEKIKIGCIFALTGDGADWGQDEAEATRLAIEEVNKEGGINGQIIELVLEDGPAEVVNSGVSAFQKLVNVHKVPAILGPTWDDVAAALAPLADRNKVVILAPDASSGIEKEKRYDYFFSVFAPEKSEMEKLVKFLKDQGVQKVATVYNLDPFSQQWRDTFKKAAEDENLQIILDLAVSDPEAKDFRTQIARLKQENVDAIYIEFTSQDTKGPFMRQAKELKLGSIIVSSHTSDTQSLLDSYGEYLDGLYIVSTKKTEATEELLERFQEKFGHSPRSPAVPYAYDAAKILIEILSQGARTGEEIKNGLYQLKDFAGVTAPSISIDESGRVEWPAEVYDIKVAKSGQFLKIDK